MVHSHACSLTWRRDTHFELFLYEGALKYDSLHKYISKFMKEQGKATKAASDVKEEL